MSNGGSQSGVFYFKNLGAAGAFPKSLRRSPLSRVDPRFTGLFAGLLVVIFAAIWILSHQKIKEEAYSEKEILKIQERYAQLVLNQPKPKAPPVEKETKAKVEKTSAQQKGKAEEAAKEKAPKVNREKESFVQREERREASRESREQVRQQVRQQVMSSGIFAAITATGGGDAAAGPKVSDFLSTATSDLSEIGGMNVSKGTFASKNIDAVDAAELGKTRKGERVSNVDIEKHSVGKAAVSQLASAGSVNITSQAPEVTGEASNIEERTQAAISRVVTRETQRLKRVYEDWLKRDPQLAGRLKVKFQILPSGSVASVVILESTTSNSEFDETILRYIRRWQFSPVSGGAVEVVYPFVFEGQS